MMMMMMRRRSSVWVFECTLLLVPNGRCISINSGYHRLVSGTSFLFARLQVRLTYFNWFMVKHKNELCMRVWSFFLLRVCSNY